MNALEYTRQLEAMSIDYSLTDVNGQLTIVIHAQEIETYAL